MYTFLLLSLVLADLELHLVDLFLELFLVQSGQGSVLLVWVFALRRVRPSISSPAGYNFSRFSSRRIIGIRVPFLGYVLIADIVLTWWLRQDILILMPLCTLRRESWLEVGRGALLALEWIDWMMLGATASRRNTNGIILLLVGLVLMEAAWGRLNDVDTIVLGLLKEFGVLGTQLAALGDEWRVLATGCLSSIDAAIPTTWSGSTVALSPNGAQRHRCQDIIIIVLDRIFSSVTGATTLAPL